MKRMIGLLAAACLALVCFVSCGWQASTEGTVTEEKAAPTKQADAGGPEEELLTGKYHIEIDVQDYGTIRAELDADIAPYTVTNFVQLIEKGFYDGLAFHRIISGFMIQGGDPNGDGTGGSEKTIRGEFASNGVENSLQHVRGTLSMARAQDFNSASSQFFIVHQDAPHLDGEYAAFGTVTDGMEVVDQICETVTTGDENGLVPPEDQPVITSINMID